MSVTKLSEEVEISQEWKEPYEAYLQTRRIKVLGKVFEHQRLSAWSIEDMPEHIRESFEEDMWEAFEEEFPSLKVVQ